MLNNGNPAVFKKGIRVKVVLNISLSVVTKALATHEKFATSISTVKTSWTWVAAWKFHLLQH